MQKTTQILTLAVLIGIVTTQTAHAYIDPGSGSAIMAAVIGFFVAVGITVKTYWYKILGFFGKGSSSTDETK